MGLAPAVAIAEHFHRDISTAQMESGLRVFPLARSQEVRRDLPLPELQLQVRPDGVVGAHAWTIYIDDFAELEDLDFRDLTKLQGTTSPELEALLLHYDEVGLPGTIDSRRLPRTKILGEDVNGAMGRRDLPSTFQAGLCDMVAWAGSQPRL